MEQIIIASVSISGLNTKIAEKIAEGYEPVGGHQVVTTKIDIQNAGNRHVYRSEYSQTMRKV